MRRPIIVLCSLAAAAAIADYAYRAKHPSAAPPPSARTASPPRGDPRLRQAGHRGLTYLASASREWTDRHQCFGCHVQAVTMEALAAGQHHQYDVGKEDLAAMVSALERGVTAGGRVTGAAFQGAAWARYDRWVAADHMPELLRWADTLIELQNADGALVDDDARRPITGGTMQTTFQAAQTWRQAHARSADEKWLVPLRRAEAFLAKTAAGWKDSGEDADLQDLNFALLGLVSSGAGPGEPSMERLHKMLMARQNADGGWSLDRARSDAFATGQTVYALELAGYGGEAVERGRAFLLTSQEAGGSWRTYRSGQGGAEKGETMWAVLGLVTVDVANIRVEGVADGKHVEGKVQIAVQASDNTSGGIRELELILDDLSVEKRAQDALRFTLDADRLSKGLHVLDVVATNAKGQESRRRYELYAGDVHLTQVAADFDEAAQRTRVTLRSIGAAGTVGLEIWDVDERGEAKSPVYRTEKLATEGPMSFDWAGETGDGQPRATGRYLAQVTKRSPSGEVLETATALFFHDSERLQKQRFGEVEGQLSLKDGQAASNTIVELVDANDRVVQTTRTTEQGNYRFKNLNEGGYKVRTKKAGFRDLEQHIEAKANSAPAAARMRW